jgi:hypothetical protein
MRTTPAKPSPSFLVEDEADAEFLRAIGARVSLVRDVVGQAEVNTVLIARADARAAREALTGMNLTATGRYIDLGRDGSLAALVQSYQGVDPLPLLDELARDIYFHEERPLSAWEAEEPKPGLSSGFGFLDPYLRWTCPELVIFAGPYGCGKSSLARLLAYKWADTIGRRDNARVSIVGWEDSVSTVKCEVLRYALEGDVKVLTSVQARRLADMQDRIRWTQRHPDDERLLQWYGDLVTHRAKYHGVRFFIFDPFNEHDSTRAKGEMETEYVRRVMIQFRKLVHGLGIVLLVVTHVSARSYDETGGIRPFRVANAAGSVQFGNKADRGVCILRASSLRDAASLNAEEHMVLNFDKNRVEEVMGRRGTIACVYDPMTMTLTFDPGATAEARKQWS